MTPDQLPATIRELADWRWGEPGFRRAELSRLAQAAQAAGLAARGGQVQLRTAEAVHELYWTDYDPTPRRDGEAWEVWAARSWKELLFLITDLPDNLSLAAEAADRFEDLDLADPDDVWFVVYLESAASPP